MRTTVPAIVLAAGQSRRMGSPKSALAAGAGETFASRIARTLCESGLSPVVFVTSPEGRRVLHDALSEWLSRVTTIENPHPERGQLSSLRCGLEYLDVESHVALVTLVDVPFTTPETIAALVAAWRSHAAPVVRPRCGDVHGHPIVIGARGIGAVMSADLRAHTMRDVMATFASERLEVPVDDAWRLSDIDTPAEYEAVRRHLTKDARRSDDRAGV